MLNYIKHVILDFSVIKFSMPPRKQTRQHPAKYRENKQCQISPRILFGVFVKFNVFHNLFYPMVYMANCIKDAVKVLRNN